MVDNPETDGINTSSKCIKFTMTNNENKMVKLPFGEWFKESMNGRKRISLMIKKNVNENVMVELSDPTDGSAGYWNKQVVYYTGEGKWQKLVFDYTANGDFDNPGLMTITAQTGDVNDNQDVYIDNIVIEDAPKINGKLFSEYNAENKLTGDVKLTGAWMKGSSMNANVSPWQANTYNDYEYFYSLADNITSVDLREAQASDVDVKQFFKNPNTIVYANEAYDHANVVATQKFKNANNEEVTALYAAKGLELIDANAFSCPYAFTAANVKLTRNVREGINSFVLPFYAGADELGADALATFKEADAQKVLFTKADHADANVPFITVGLKDAADNKVFDFFGNQKYVEVTPASFDNAFKGVYAHRSAENLYGIDAAGKLHKGGAKATINAFHAYYLPADGAEAPANISFDGEAAGIDAVSTPSTSANGAVYDLSGRRVAANLAAAKLAKGIYVVNGKKVAVK
ncbi:MAG: hypothetical protein EGR08_01020 [Prevotella sp.]|nr:hypothetical protein [Prevotella sp.]